MPSLKVYADTRTLRARQVVGDAAVVVWVAVWARVGFWLKDLVERLARPGQGMEEAGNRIAGWRAPFLGRDLGPITSGGESLARAGESQQDVVHTLSLWLALLVAGLPIAWMLGRHLPGRLRWAQEAAAANRIGAGAGAARLFALRALARRPLRELRRAELDPAEAYERGDYEALAALELAHLGLRPFAGHREARDDGGSPDWR